MLLQDALGLDLDLLLAFGEHLVDRVAPDHLAHGGLGRRAHRAFRIAHVEQEIGRPARIGAAPCTGR